MTIVEADRELEQDADGRRDAGRELEQDADGGRDAGRDPDRDACHGSIRRRLRSIALTGRRGLVRRAGFLVVGAAAVVAAIGYVLPAHRLVYVPRRAGVFDLAAQPGATAFHANYADGGVLPLLALAIAAVAALLLRRCRWLGAGVIAGVAGASAAVVTVMPLILVHMFSRYETASGEHLFACGVVGLFVAGCALVVVEPLLFVLERRHLARRTRPAPLPLAIARRSSP
jgi:hypothetical protein